MRNSPSDTPPPNESVLRDSYKDMIIRSRRENKSRMPTETAEKLAIQSYPSTNKGIIEDVEGQNCTHFFPKKELSESILADKDESIVPPPPEDLIYKQEAEESRKIQLIMTKVNETKDELKIKAVSSVIGMPKSIKEIDVVSKKIIEAEGNEDVWAICESEGITLDDKDE